MPQDGQAMPLDPATDSPILPDLLSLSAEATKALDGILEIARQTVAARVTVAGRIDSALLEAEQTATHGLAWLATYAQALRQMQAWADRLDAEGRFGEMEALLHQIAFGEYLWQVYGGLPMSQGEIVRLQDLGLSQEDQRGLMVPAVMTLCNEGNSQVARTRLVALMRDGTANATFGQSG
ncbi:MAG: acyl-CoA dehydrogenase, partial [Pseudomonadota bacterium]